MTKYADIDPEEEEIGVLRALADSTSSEHGLDESYFFSSSPSS